MKLFTIEEIKKLNEEQGYKYFALFDQSGKKIIPFNPNRITGLARLADIEKRLKSAGIQDGYYVVKAKGTLAKDSIADEFIIRKGKDLPPLSETPGVEVKILPPAQQSTRKQTPAADELLTYESALALNITIKEQQLEIERLEEKVLDLETALDDFEDEEEEGTGLLSGNGSMLESAKDFLGQLAEMAAPILDKHYDLKEKQLALDAMRLKDTRRVKRQEVIDELDPEEEDYLEEDEVDIEEWIHTFSGEPERYQVLVNIFNTASGEDDFYNKVQEADSEAYNSLIELTDDGTEVEASEDNE